MERTERTAFKSLRRWKCTDDILRVATRSKMAWSGIGGVACAEQSRLQRMRSRASSRAHAEQLIGHKVRTLKMSTCSTFRLRPSVNRLIACVVLGDSDSLIICSRMVTILFSATCLKQDEVENITYLLLPCRSSHTAACCPIIDAIGNECSGDWSSRLPFLVR